MERPLVIVERPLVIVERPLVIVERPLVITKKNGTAKEMEKFLLDNSEKGSTFAAGCSSVMSNR